MSRYAAISSQLPTNRLGQVDSSLGFQIGSIREKRLKQHGYFRADFEAACANTGTNGYDEIFRPAAEVSMHRLDSFRDDTIYNSPPARMNGGYCPISNISDQNWEAVRGPDGEGNAWTVRDQGITFTGATRVLGQQNVVGVDLAECRQTVLVGPIGTGSRSETVLQPGNLREGAGSIDCTPVQVEQILFYRAAAAARYFSTVWTSSRDCTGLARKPCIPVFMQRSR